MLAERTSNNNGWRRRAWLVLSVMAFTSLALAQTAIRSDFDHDSTGFPLDGAHLIANCGTCHAQGLFAGTLRQCADCHEDGSLVLATTKPALHILTTQQCDACHATRSFRPLNRMDHNETIGDCVSCHNNTLARGKHAAHPPASDECDTCHLTVAFSPQFPGGVIPQAGSRSAPNAAPSSIRPATGRLARGFERTLKR